MRQRNIGWRLDYVLASGALAAQTSRCVSMREFGTSDHAPVVATFGDVVAVMIIVSDFDGTLTLDDVTTYIWDKYLPYDWRAKLLPPTYEGRWTPLEMIAHGYADIRVPPKELLAEIRDNVRLRPGVEALATFCRGRGWHFAVVSHGLAFYIEALLPSWIPFTSFVGTFNEWSWRVVAADDDDARRPGKTSRAASSPTCARATPAIRWPTSATAGSTCRRR